MNAFPTSLFGDGITAHEIITTMQQLHSWEDRYRQIIVWGKMLPQLPDELKSLSNLISGCESQVWLIGNESNGVYSFCANSDARIIQGLIAVVLAALNHKTIKQIHEFDIDVYFGQLGLLSHLSPSRENGLKAIVDKIKQYR